MSKNDEYSLREEISDHFGCLMFLVIALAICFALVSGIVNNDLFDVSGNSGSKDSTRMHRSGAEY